jgi:hypothetical protein
MTDVEICNLALAHLGSSKQISDLETERSNEANACRQFYDTARDKTLKDFEWPFATKLIALSLVEEDPSEEWSYSYQYPTDCLFFRRILSGLRNDTNDSQVKYKIFNVDGDKQIFTDQPEAKAEYTMRVTDGFAEDFANTCALLLAHYIAPRVASGDQFRRGEKCFQLYMIERSESEANAANEEKRDQEPETDSVRARY